MARLYFLLLLLALYIYPYSISSQNKYVLETKTDALPLVIKRAYQQIGVSRGDSIVLGYLKTTGLESYNNWCAAGIVWSFTKGFADYNSLFNTNILIPIEPSAVANRHYNYARENGKNVYYESEIYDLIVWRQVNSWQGHIEIVIQVRERGWVTTIGFNTSSNDTRQGGFVEIKGRHIHNPLGRLQVRGLVGFINKE